MVHHGGGRQYDHDLLILVAHLLHEDVRNYLGIPQFNALFRRLRSRPSAYFKRRYYAAGCGLSYAPYLCELLGLKVRKPPEVALSCGKNLRSKRKRAVLPGSA